MRSKKGSGLVIGLLENGTCISSDLPSILPLTRKIVRMNDGEIVVLYPDHVELYRAVDGSRIEREPELVTESMEVAKKGGFPHFMLKEIHEQPVVATELLHMLGRFSGVEAIAQKLRTARRVYLVGCGTSYHACVLGAVYLSRIAGIPAVPVLAPQFVAQYIPAVGAEDVAVFVSQSGETKDVLNAIEAAQKSGITVFGMANVVGSTLMRVSEVCMPLVCGYEISVPATKTFSNQVLAFLYLALKTAGKSVEVLDRIPELMTATIESTAAQIEPLIPSLVTWNDLYCLGYGLTYPIALEGALKLKEITYAHCEGMLSTEFKHGPLSAVSENFPVLFVTGPEDVPVVVSGINEVTCRGGRAIAIGLEDSRLRANATDLIVLPITDPYIFALLSVIPLQLLSYYLSISRCYDPDFPRNLSKTLTVD